MTRIEIDGRVWTSPDDLPEHVKLEDVREVLRLEGRRSYCKLGVTIYMGAPEMRFTWTETLCSNGPDCPICWTKPQAHVHQEGTGEGL